MRGVKSITGSNLALYVIDGVPMYNMAQGGSGSIFSDQPGTDGVADINPEDIESISMLTGPSAAALYGNAAASGVVLITTKKGNAGKTSLTISNSTTFSNVAMMPEMQSRYGNKPNVLASWGDTPERVLAVTRFPVVRLRPAQPSLHIFNFAPFSVGQKRPFKRLLHYTQCLAKNQEQFSFFIRRRINRIK